MHIGIQLLFVNIIQMIGIAIPLFGMLALIRKSKELSNMRLMLANVGCLVLNMGYLMVLRSMERGAMLNAYKMEFLGNVLFYYFIAYFIVSYLHLKNKVVQIVSCIWVLMDIFSTIAIWEADLREQVFGEIYMKNLSTEDAPTFIKFDAGPIYSIRYSVIAAILLLGLIYTSVRFFKTKVKSVRFNLALLAAAQLVIVISLSITLLFKPNFDIVPICASLSVLAIILNSIKGDFYDVMDESHSYMIMNSANAYIIMDEKYGLLEANPTAEEVFPELKATAVTREVPQSILDAMTYLDGEIFELQDKLFEKKTISFENKGEVCGYGLKLIDVTENCRLVEQVEVEKDKAQAANEAKSNFLSNMSHEIRTPMNAIVGMTEILLRENTDNQTREYLNNIKNSGDALLTIINDILDFSKIESGKMEIIESDYEPMSVFHDLSMIILNRIGEKPVELLYDIDMNMPARLCGDSQRVRQIIINLMNNATKFTESGYVKLTVKLESVSEDVGTFRFEIADTGQGIRQEDISKLFGTYSQVDTKKNHAKEGTGLGLSICKQLVTLMDGEIGVESEYGKGSVFWFTIPQRIVDSEPAAKIKKAFSAPSSLTESSDGEARVDEPRRKIAVKVENEFVYRQILKLAEDYGVECISVEDIEEKGVDYVITDSSFCDCEDCHNFVDKLKVPSCILQNPMTDNLVGHKAVIINKPLYSLNFCQLMNHEDVSFHTVSDKLRSFTAPSAKLLIADDNDMNLKVARGLLEPYNMDITTASNGKEAAALVKGGSFDMVFMDHMMPVMDGIEATQAIRAFEGEYFANLPIVALSANATQEAREMFANANMNDFVSKPIRPKELYNCLVRWLPEDKIVYSEDSADALEAGKDGASESEQGAFAKPELPQIEGIDNAEGVLNSGSEKLFLSLLGDFYKLIEPKSVKLEKCLADGMIRDYTIEVHALKNTARMIGATELSGMFYELEQLGNAGDIDTISQKHPAVLELYRSYKERLKAFAAGDRSELLEVPNETIAEALTSIHDCMDCFDLDGVDEALKKLESYALPEELTDMEQQLSAFVADVDMEKVMELSAMMRDALAK